MKVLLRPGVLDELQKQKGKTDQEFADFLGISRSQLWRIKLPADDSRFSLGQDIIAKILSKLPQLTFEEIFFLDNPSHECDSDVASTHEINTA